MFKVFSKLFVCFTPGPPEVLGVWSVSDQVIMLGSQTYPTRITKLLQGFGKTGSSCWKRETSVFQMISEWEACAASTVQGFFFFFFSLIESDPDWVWKEVVIIAAKVAHTNPEGIGDVYFKGDESLSWTKFTCSFKLCEDTLLFYYSRIFVYSGLLSFYYPFFEFLASVSNHYLLCWFNSW